MKTASRHLLIAATLAVTMLIAVAPTVGAQEYPLHTQPIPQTFDEQLAPGAKIQFEIGGFEPFATVTVTLESDPIVLGTFTADGDGVVNIDVVIPAAVPAGQHDLKVTGASADGGILVASAPVDVFDPAAPAASSDRSGPHPAIYLAIGTTALLGLIAVVGFRREA